jgi:hypothetical protein
MRCSSRRKQRETLMELVKEWISDRRALKLIRAMTAKVDGHPEIPGASHTEKIIVKPSAWKTARTV